MSDRKLEQANDRATLRLSHELQIDALLARGFTRTQRIKRFAHAAGFDYVQYDDAMFRDRTSKKSATAAAICWQYGYVTQSIFGKVPGFCGCPVQMRQLGWPVAKGIPYDVEVEWKPTRKVLEAFSAVQLEARFPE